MYSLDGNPHEMELYLDASSQHAVNSNSQAVGWGEWTFGHGETAVRGVRLGSAVQHVLKSKGDRVNIDWGYLYLAVQNHSHSAVWAGSARTARSFFVKHGTVVPTPDRRQPRASANDYERYAVSERSSKDLVDQYSADGRTFPNWVR